MFLNLLDNIIDINYLTHNIIIMKKYIRIALLLLTITLSCSKSDESKIDVIQGRVEKGPFAVESQVNVTELNDDMAPT